MRWVDSKSEIVVRCKWFTGVFRRYESDNDILLINFLREIKGLLGEHDGREFTISR